ncbi:Hypothetical predicted protein [Mytilus galloprovincialis]|uniref:Uncharacterized protein n=1 Tax=Mytilus galloprovincialis TaxID=29158 RepID=A0A8B6CLB7_MYTGA|nr:Hypothetical predicted protein [Mytilus galloprovincialis]
MDNNKVDKFSSLYWNPGSSAVDAFSCHWAQENNLLVPPVSLVCKCINHLVRCKAEGTLIVPSWPSSPYWPLIFDENTEYRSYVLDVLEFNEKIFSTGFWKNDTQVKHTELKILFRKMKNSVIDSKARNTTVKYAYSFKRFVVWSEKYTEIKSVLPANEIYVSLYLQYLMQSAKHYSTIEAACYAIKWAHSLAGFEDPCASDIVKCIVEASKRKLNRPIQKKRTDECKHHAQSF